MEELITKVEALKQSLDQNENVIKIKKIQEELLKDKELLKLIEKYHYNPQEDIKRKIYDRPLYKDYKETETDINLLILSINQTLKQISDKGKCGL